MKPAPTTTCRAPASSCAALVLVALLALGALAEAQPAPPAPSAPGEPELSGPARKLFLSGQAARDTKDYEACYLDAHGAWKLDQSPGVAALLGDCAFDLKKYRETAEYLTWFFAHPPKAPKPKLLSYMNERLELAKREIATIEITTNVADASRLVDGQPIEPRVVFLDPGPHTFEAQAEGHQPAKQTHDLTRGEARTVHLTLTPTPVEHPPIDTPPSHPSAITYPLLLGVGFGLAGAGAIAAAVFGGLSSGHQSDADAILQDLERTEPSAPCAAPSSACDEILASREAQRTLVNASLWTGISAGTLLVATVIYAIAGAPTNDEGTTTTTAPRVTPIATERELGVTLHLTW